MFAVIVYSHNLEHFTNILTLHISIITTNCNCCDKSGTLYIFDSHKMTVHASSLAYIQQKMKLHLQFQK